MPGLDFVAVGHVTLDHFGDTMRPGGAALFAAVTAQRLGLSVGILTSHADDFPLDLIPPQIEVVSVPADETTHFTHREQDGRRLMDVPTVAGPLGPADVPNDWADARIVLLAPVVDEVEPLVVTAFPEATVGAAAQGWLRSRDREGALTIRPWMPHDFLLGRLQAIFLSREDVTGHEAAIVELFQRVPIGVLTADRHGAFVFVNGERYEIKPRPALQSDATGAGDVFAATFLVQYDRTGDAWEAAAAAACAGSLAVEGAGWSSLPDRAGLDAALTRYNAERNALP
jgi:sugar/nucleoside kinase (ribokinase family)